MRKDMMLVLAESQGSASDAGRGERLRDADGRPAAGPRRPDVAAVVAFMERMAGMDDYPWPIGEEAEG